MGYLLKLMAPVWLLIFGALLAVLEGAEFNANYRGRYFEVEKEFPNFFIPKEFRGKPIEEIPYAVLNVSQVRLEKALASVFRRLLVSVIKRGSQKPELVPYFSYMENELKKIDPSVEIYPSGGVVRASISFIYSRLYELISEDPSRSAEEILDQISSENHSILSYQVRGIGSDFDILLKSTRENFYKLRQEAMAITNSSLESVQSNAELKSLNRSLFLVGDIRDYDTQTNRSMNQGGSTLDYLAFDYRHEKFIEPKEFPHIVKNFLKGIYSYISPTEKEAVEKPDITMIRGIRSLLELPFLRLDDETAIKRDLSHFLKRLKKGQAVLVDDVVEQLHKAARNARFSGAHNRLYRGGKDSLESVILEVVKALSGRDRNLPIPEFVDSFPLKSRSNSVERSSNFPEELLLPVPRFIEEFTQDGIVFHGTPNIENGLSIIRGGLYVSSSRQGHAAFGRGGYITPHRKTAEGYAGSSGIVFELKIDQAKDIRILNIDKVQNHPFLKKNS